MEKRCLLIFLIVFISGILFSSFCFAGLEAKPLTMMNGTLLNGLLGFSLDGNFDFNNDGYDDIIVSAAEADAGGLDVAGQALIFYGSNNKGNLLDGEANITINGTQSWSFLGLSVSSAGDFNNDGYDDIIVGAYNMRAGGINGAGRALIFYGSEEGNGIHYTPSDANVAIYGEKYLGWLGAGVSDAGDFNNDGYDDVIISVLNSDTGGISNTGQALIFYGGNIDNEIYFSSDANIIINGTKPHSFSKSIGGGGDFNNDGYDDIIIGSPNFNSGDVYLSGQVNIFYGSGVNYANYLMYNANITINGTKEGGNLGYSVSDAGDFNGDGYDDVIIGSQELNAGGIYQSGQALIFYGTEEGKGIQYFPHQANVTINGTIYNGVFGYSVSGAGRINNDVYHEVIIGAPGVPNSGKAYLFYGREIDDIHYSLSDSDISFVGEEQDAFFGYSVSNVGNFNNVGKNEIIIGSPGVNSGGKNNAGQARVYEFLFELLQKKRFLWLVYPPTTENKKIKKKLIKMESIKKEIKKIKGIFKPSKIKRNSKKIVFNPFIKRD